MTIPLEETWFSGYPLSYKDHGKTFSHLASRIRWELTSVWDSERSLSFIDFLGVRIRSGVYVPESMFPEDSECRSRVTRGVHYFSPRVPVTMKTTWVGKKVSLPFNPREHTIYYGGLSRRSEVCRGGEPLIRRLSQTVVTRRKFRFVTYGSSTGPRTKFTFTQKVLSSGSVKHVIDFINSTFFPQIKLICLHCSFETPCLKTILVWGSPYCATLKVPGSVLPPLLLWPLSSGAYPSGSGCLSKPEVPSVRFVVPSLNEVE